MPSGAIIPEESFHKCMVFNLVNIHRENFYKLNLIHEIREIFFLENNPLYRYVYALYWYI